MNTDEHKARLNALIATWRGRIADLRDLGDDESAAWLEQATEELQAALDALA